MCFSKRQLYLFFRLIFNYAGTFVHMQTGAMTLDGRSIRASGTRVTGSCGLLDTGAEGQTLYNHSEMTKTQTPLPPSLHALKPAKERKAQAIHDQRNIFQRPGKFLYLKFYLCSSPHSFPGLPGHGFNQGQMFTVLTSAAGGQPSCYGSQGRKLISELQ